MARSIPRHGLNAFSYGCGRWAEIAFAARGFLLTYLRPPAVGAWCLPADGSPVSAENVPADLFLLMQQAFNRHVVVEPLAGPKAD